MNPKNYELQDGLIITIGNERFGSPTVLFKPPLKGIDKLTYDSIMKCDVDIKRDVCRNTVLSGGTTIHLIKEMTVLPQASIKVKYSSTRKKIWCLNWWFNFIITIIHVEFTLFYFILFWENIDIQFQCFVE